MKNKLNKLTSLLLALVLMFSLCFAVTGCGSSSASSGSSAAASGAASGGTIKIGASFPLSGSVATDGKMIVTAIQMAVDEVNAQGGVKIGGKSYTVELDSEDDQADPTTAATIANKFVDDSSMMAVISSYNSSCMLAQVGTYDTAGLPSISPVATSPDLSGSSAYFHRVVNSDAYTGKLDADVMVTIYVPDLSVKPEMNEVYETYFPDGNYPCRCCTQCAALDEGCLIEIQFTAIVD